MLTPYIDSHCHLTDKAFDEDREAAIQRMKDAGMVAGITIGCEDGDIKPLRAILDAHPGFLFGAWAVHPEYPELREADVDEIAERANEPGMVTGSGTASDATSRLQERPGNPSSFTRGTPKAPRLKSSGKKKRATSGS